MFWAFVVFCALQSAAQASTRKIDVRASASGSVTLQPWLTGLTAVVVFLFVVFVFVVLSRLLGKDREDRVEEEDMFGYENKVVEMREDEVKQTSL